MEHSIPYTTSRVQRRRNPDSRHRSDSEQIKFSSCNFSALRASHDEETFVNQLLILAQKPDAQSVSDREDWEKIGCQVGRESIVLLDEEDAYNLYPVWTEKTSFRQRAQGKMGVQSPL